MTVSGKSVSQIVITTTSNEVLAVVSDEEVIENGVTVVVDWD